MHPPSLDVVKRNYGKILGLVKELFIIKGFHYKEIYVFQSRVAGTARPDSDIDIYVQLAEEHRKLVEEEGVEYFGVKVLTPTMLLEGLEELRIKFAVEHPVYIEVYVGMAEKPPAKDHYKNTTYYVNLKELAP